MNIKEYQKDYRAYLNTNSDPNRAEKEKAYLYSDLKHYGLSTAQRNKFFKENKKFLKELPRAEVLKLVDQLWSKPSHEERSMALTVLNMHHDKLVSSDMPMIEKMMRESRGWAFLDSLIIPVMPVLLEHDDKNYEYLHKWIKDDDFWVRRSALLAQLLFFRHDNGGDQKLFFDLAKSQFDESWIDQVYDDRETITRARFFIRKAIGWTLREMSHKQPEVVFNFLLENKDQMSGLSFREGSRKLPEKAQKKLKSV